MRIARYRRTLNRRDMLSMLDQEQVKPLRPLICTECSFNCTNKSPAAFSYTNSAVITLRKRIGADPHLLASIDEPVCYQNAHRTITEPVLLSTVDQLALAILAGLTRTRTYGARSQNFDQIIIDAPSS